MRERLNKKVIVKRVIYEYYEYESKEWTNETKYEDAKKQVIDCIKEIGIDGTTNTPFEIVKNDFIDDESIYD